MTAPRVFSHIGLTVVDIEVAVRFYTAVFGCSILMAPTEIVEAPDTAIGQMCKDVFGEGWTRFRIAHLTFGDRIGLELFEFIGTERRADNFEYRKAGTTHFCVTDPDLEGALARVLAHGGRQRMPVRFYYPNQKPFRMVYCEDPSGNVFEIYSHSYEMTYSAGAY